jgi:hypothetical protein
MCAGTLSIGQRGAAHHAPPDCRAVASHMAAELDLPLLARRQS